MADERFSILEIRRTIAASLTAAFGCVIDLVWNNVVLGALAAANINLTAGTDATGVIISVIAALVITVVMVLPIVMISRWVGKQAPP